MNKDQVKNRSIKPTKLALIFLRLHCRTFVLLFLSSRKQATAQLLDTYDKNRDVLIFKNTYDNPESGQPKKYEIARNRPNAPQELYFVHIQIRDMDNLAPIKSHYVYSTLEAENEELPTQAEKDRVCCFVC